MEAYDENSTGREETRQSEQAKSKKEIRGERWRQEREGDRNGEVVRRREGDPWKGKAEVRRRGKVASGLGHAKKRPRSKTPKGLSGERGGTNTQGGRDCERQKLGPAVWRLASGVCVCGCGCGCGCGPGVRVCVCLCTRYAFSVCDFFFS